MRSVVCSLGRDKYVVMVNGRVKEVSVIVKGEAVFDVTIDGQSVVVVLERGKLKLRLRKEYQWEGGFNDKVYRDHLSIKFTYGLVDGDMYEDFLNADYVEVLPVVEDMRMLYCKYCYLELLNDGVINKVQRLPRDHWEELKDEMWVCSCSADNLLKNKAIPRGPIRGMPGRILIGESDLLIHSDNSSTSALNIKGKNKLTTNSKKKSGISDDTIKTERMWRPCYCSRCWLSLGIVEQHDDYKNIKLLKHNVTTVPKYSMRRENIFHYFTTETRLSAMMKSIIEIHTSYKFFICSRESEQKMLQIIVTNWDTEIAVDYKSTPQFKSDQIYPVLQLCFTDCFEDQSSIEKWMTQTSIESIFLPLQEIFEIASLLTFRNEMMPESLRLFPNKMRQSFIYLPPPFSV